MLHNLAEMKLIGYVNMPGCIQRHNNALLEFEVRFIHTENLQLTSIFITVLQHWDINFISLATMEKNYTKDT